MRCVQKASSLISWQLWSPSVHHCKLGNDKIFHRLDLSPACDTSQEDLAVLVSPAHVCGENHLSVDNRRTQIVFAYAQPWELRVDMLKMAEPRGIYVTHPITQAPPTVCVQPLLCSMGHISI